MVWESLFGLQWVKWKKYTISKGNFVKMFMSTFLKKAHRGHVYDFLVFWLQIAIEPFSLFHHEIFIICVSLW